MQPTVKPGKYLAKVIDYGIGETKAGLPQVLVMFEFKDSDGVQQQMVWYGTLKEGKGRDITIDSLLVCGFRGNDIEVLAEGIGNGALDTEKEVQLTIGEEPDQNGKMRTRIQWVNAPGGSAFREKLSKQETVSKFQGLNLNLKADVMARRQATGQKTPPAQNLQTGVQRLSDNEVPF